MKHCAYLTHAIPDMLLSMLTCFTQAVYCNMSYKKGL